ASLCSCVVAYCWHEHEHVLVLEHSQRDLLLLSHINTTPPLHQRSQHTSHRTHVRHTCCPLKLSLPNICRFADLSSSFLFSVSGLAKKSLTLALCTCIPLLLYYTTVVVVCVMRCDVPGKWKSDEVQINFAAKTKR